MTKAPPDRPLAALNNIGKISARRLADAEIETEGDLRALGAVAVYQRVKHVYPRETSLVMLYALQGALLDVH